MSGEAALPNGVLTKENEPGAFGVGVDMLDWFNKRIQGMVFK